MKRLFVGNLPYQANEGELQDWFTASGIQVDSVSIVRDKFSGEPRGFGFVNIQNDADADRAVTTCNGKDFQGRTLKIDEARPAEGRGGFGGGEARQGGGRERRDRY